MMIRTNIYLEAGQSAELAREAAELGVTRAELIRRFIDRGLGKADSADLEGDLSAIQESFGVLAGDGGVVERADGTREWHLDRIWRR